MDADDLFIRTLSDLERRTTVTDEYEALMSAGLLRKLLLDSTPLMDQVNLNHRLKVRFRINGESPLERVIHEDRPMYWLLGDAIDPDAFHPPGIQAPVDATRSQLFARHVMSVQGNWMTVRDLISQLANIEGAVHSGKPQNPREELLEQVSRLVFIGNLPAGVRQVQSIGRVVVRGLTPLRDAVIAARDAT